MDTPQRDAERSSKIDVSPVSNSGHAGSKVQPWKLFCQPAPAQGRPMFETIGDGSIRLTAELDDKDIGG